MKEAACRGALPHNFYLATIEDDLRAIRVCVNCPVKDPCLDWAIFNGETGVWGGTTYSEREKIRVSSMVTGIPVGELRRNILRVSAQDWHEVQIPHKKQREPERLASVFLSPSVHTSIRQMRSQVHAVKVAALQSLSFHSAYKESAKSQSLSQPDYLAS